MLVFGDSATDTPDMTIVKDSIIYFIFTNTKLLLDCVFELQRITLNDFSATDSIVFKLKFRNNFAQQNHKLRLKKYPTTML